MNAWVVTVDMGLGHQRATYPLSYLAEGGIITLGSSSAGHPANHLKEARLWKQVQHTYEMVSRIKSVPVVGNAVFNLMDTLLRIPPYYPRRDLSGPTFQVKLLSSLIDRGLCRSMLETIQRKPLPLLTSYLAPAVAADRAGYHPVYCILCDAEIARAWVPADPEESRIHYLAPCARTVMRLESYGVPRERISLTGFPFPREILGNRDLDVLRFDLTRRLYHLDPKKNGRQNNRALTITFAVGGAGAQGEIGRQIAWSLRHRLERGEVRLNLVAGVREEVRAAFERFKADLLPGNPNLRIVYGRSKSEYFRRFSQIIRGTDVLWTKPSELSFYCGLGIPIVLSPPIGSQEVYNAKWLLAMQAAVLQEDPQYTDQWLFDFLNEGRLVECARHGFLKVEKRGTYNIEEIVSSTAAAEEPADARLAIA